MCTRNKYKDLIEQIRCMDTFATILMLEHLVEQSCHNDTLLKFFLCNRTELCFPKDPNEMYQFDQEFYIKSTCLRANSTNVDIETRKNNIAILEPLSDNST